MKCVFRKAQPGDEKGIRSILEPHITCGVILDRTEDDILNNIDDFMVAICGDIYAGTVTFHDYGSHLKEIRSLAVRSEYQHHGIGRKLVETLVETMKSTDVRVKIFTLTLVQDFFIKIGFSIVDKNELPEKIWKDCVYCIKQDHCDETALIYRM